ncbi:drug/metabolite exporter YedA [Chromobacterium sp. Panama]|uniref:drug/metabolite exporter YedA n=1 Tax=Chromobacterium sp. Panama TaxID=2161826 RepID=UPI000D314543|nr:drug/metabolite exporter YedA [Chromobacterium sp. Panama]PTU67914.1 drug/metabolite exporter YedA [Chromobacterium sp. Panama]
MPFSRIPPLTLAAFFALYVIWGSTYMGIRIGIESWPPMMMAGLRFSLAGWLMLAYLCLRKYPMPNARELGGAALLGVLMPAVGNGLVTVAEKDVSSGVAALVIATVPLFTLLFARMFGQKARKVEWAGIGLGVCGMVLLNMGANLKASPSGAALLLLASAGWGLGSAWSRHLAQPKGPMGSAWMMIFGGAALLLASQAYGEKLQAMPTLSSWLALFYLAVFGSIIAYSAYLHLLKTVSPAAATSYAYVNPVIAVLLGVVFLGEHIGLHEMLAMSVIVAAVVLISWWR